MAPVGLLEHLKVDDTLGAVFVGFAASCAIYGLLNVQVYTYYGHYPCDRKIYKILVATIWMFETVDQCFIGHGVYYYTITNYLNPLILTAGKPIWTLILQMTLGVLVGFLVKTAFALRVWTLSNHNFLVIGIILFMAFAQLALATLYTVKCFQIRSLLNFPSLNIIASLSLGAGVMTDITIAAALCHYLQKLRTGFSKSDSIVKSLTRYAVNTGVLTSACSLVTLITYNLSPHTLIFLPFYFVLSKLYAVSFLATLNTRTIISGRGTDHDNPTHSRNTFLMHGNSAIFRMQGREKVKNMNNIYVETDVHRQISSVSGVVDGLDLSSENENPMIS